MQQKRHQTSCPIPSGKPVLSLILCSRNDQYMGNPRWRLQTTLNYLAQNVYELGREEDVEVIVSDWGSEIPLHTALQLSPAAAGMASFLVVPPALAQELQKDSPFSEVHALNAAARRANGQYIGRIDQDTLVGKRFLTTFFELHEGTRQLGVPLDSAMLFAGRRSIPYRFAARCPPLWAVDRFVDWFGRFLSIERALPTEPFYVTYVGVWLLHRDLWKQCGGYNEQWIYMFDMEMEMIARLMQKKHPVIDLGMLVDHDFYHLDHYHPRDSRSPAPHRKLNPKIDTDNPPDDLEFHPNSEAWGLVRYRLEIASCWRGHAGVRTEAPAAPPFRWSAFALLLLSTGARISCDNLVLRTSRFIRRWRHRATVACAAVRGQPLPSWLGVLRALWLQRGSSLRERE